VSSKRLTNPETVGGAPLFADGEAILHEMQEILGRKWQPILVYRLLVDEPMRFSTLKRTIDGISSKMLSESLAELEAAALVERNQVDDSPVRVEYTLTDRGRALEPVITAMVQWGDEYDVDGHDSGTDAPDQQQPGRRAVSSSGQNR